MQHSYCGCLCVGGSFGDEVLRRQGQRHPKVGYRGGTDLEGTGVRTDELLDLVTALEDEEGGHLSRTQVSTDSRPVKPVAVRTARMPTSWAISDCSSTSTL